MANNYKHIFISGKVKPEKYKAPRKQGKPTISLLQRDRLAHSAKLLNQFKDIWSQKEELNQNRTAEKIAMREGTYLSFTSAVNCDLITKSLENIKSGIRLLNVKQEEINGKDTQIKATVYIPKGKEGFFVKKIDEYQKKDNKAINTNKPKNYQLVNSIEDVKIALLESLWTDNLRLIPTENSKWCEAWLNVNTKDKHEQKQQIDLFHTTLESIRIECKKNTIIFPERVVLLINANREQLIELMLQSDLLAEFRVGQEPAGFWVNESAIEQQEWVDDLLGRIEQSESNIKVCVLDSGVNNGHQLLQPLIDNDNTLTVDESWGVDDHVSGSGHGTLMAGIIGYGKMELVLPSITKVFITHRICSVKILPRSCQQATLKELWGDITAQGIARAEIQNPKMILIYCMSVTSSNQDKNQGRPSSWSGAIDNLTFGDEEKDRRLIIISVGNIREEELWKNYPNSNYNTAIQDPAQSWNALVIGAYTEKIKVNDNNFNQYIPLANEGELSPYSSTSLSWDKQWPIKPDVVFEGGNLLKSPNGRITTHVDLELLSTSKQFNNIKSFDTINATSAATAQASWFAAKVAFEYPHAWPETIRALIIHSASWNKAMKKQQNVETGREGYRRLLRVYGFGVPELERALYSKESALTFIAEESIQPFKFKAHSKSEVETSHIHFFNLPWPKDLLLQMSHIQVTLRVTLSYFIQPGAGEIGRKDKYRYQSHGLRFDINNIGENEDDFRKRMNEEAREENEKVIGNSGSNRWVIGASNRNNGSIHSDYWEGSAADIATCNLIAVFPIIGWWRERKHLGKVENLTRYSIVVSLETPKQDVQLYTTVKNMIEVPIEIKI